MLLKTERCIVRRMKSEDAGDLFAVLSDPAVMRYIEPAFDMARTEAFIREAGMGEPPLVYAVAWKETGRVIGHVVFHRYDGADYEIGWILNREYWGMGVASELTGALIRQARAMAARSCVIECDPGQAATGHIALKNGFEFEGNTDGLDVYRLRLG